MISCLTQQMQLLPMPNSMQISLVLNANSTRAAPSPQMPPKGIVGFQTVEVISMTLNSFTYFIFLEYSLDGIDVYYLSLYFSAPSHVFG